MAESLPEDVRPPAAVTRPFHKQPATGDLVLPGVTLHLLEGVHQTVSGTAIRAAAAARQTPRPVAGSARSGLCEEAGALSWEIIGTPARTCLRGDAAAPALRGAEGPVPDTSPPPRGYNR